MASVRTYLIRCDRCGTTDDDVEGPTAAHARRQARELEWTHPVANPAVSQMRIDVCPDCSEGDL